MLKITEVFKSIQGEGICTGYPAVFVRFAGCDLACSFCDEHLKESYTYLTNAGELFNTIMLHATNKDETVIFTGGEPMLQMFHTLPATGQVCLTDEMRLLLTSLRDENIPVNIETNAQFFNKPFQEVASMLDALKPYVRLITLSPKNLETLVALQDFLTSCSQASIKFIAGHTEFKFLIPTTKQKLDGMIALAWLFLAVDKAGYYMPPITFQPLDGDDSAFDFYSTQVIPRLQSKGLTPAYISSFRPQVHKLYNKK